MRTFQLAFMVLFLIFYILISYGTLKSLLGITQPANRKKIQWSMLLVSILILVCFIVLYVWPFSARNTTDYTIHLIFNAILSVDFVFKIPLSFSFLLGISISKKHKPVIYSIGLILSIGTSISIIYGSFFGTKNLLVNKVEIEFANLPESYNGYKILQMSDIHLGNFLKSKRLMKKVQNETEIINPDIVLFTGDLVNNFSSELDGWSDIFQSITKDKLCYSILGNHDYGNYSNWENEASKIENFNQIVTAHNSFGLKLLNNEHVKLKSKTDSIYIIGVENWGHPPFPQYANLEKAMNKIPENSFNILLSHDPAHWEEVINYRDDIALTLSGHSHGMQWGINKAGITFSLSYFTRPNWGGLYNYGKSKLYVNTGIGTVGIPWRINMPPELTLITLKRVEID